MSLNTFLKIKTGNSALDLVMWSSVYCNKSCSHAIKRGSFWIDPIKERKNDKKKSFRK